MWKSTADLILLLLLFIRWLPHLLTPRVAARYGWDLSPECLLAGVGELEVERRKPNFGHAGAVNNMLASVAMHMEKRLARLSAAERSRATPLPEDFLPEGRRGSGDPAGILMTSLGAGG